MTTEQILAIVIAGVSIALIGVAIGAFFMWMKPGKGE